MLLTISRADVALVLAADSRALAGRLLAARIRAKLTTAELAGRARLAPKALARIENSTRRATVAEVAALAGALGVATAALTVGAMPGGEP